MKIELEKAIEVITNNINRLDITKKKINAALGYILADDLVAQIDQPPFNRSPLDGYALKAADTIGASKDRPVRLKVVDTVFAGGQSALEINQHEAVRLMTGSPIAHGCDCVIMQEDTNVGFPLVEIYKEHKAYQNFCFRGEDFKSGDFLLKSGTKMDAVALAVCASAGIGQINVVKKPRVSVFSTGDELVAPGQALESGQIYDANLFYICLRLEQMGLEVVMSQTIGDDCNEIANKIKNAMKQSDFIITTGGVSVGEKDLIEAAINQIGGQIKFHGVNLKPGTPAMFSVLGEIPILSLSGNPFACISTFELLARPAFSRLSGNDEFLLTEKTASLKNAYPKSSKRRRFIRGLYADGDVEIPNGHSSGQIRSMIGCNCLLDIPAGSGPLVAGDEIRIRLL
ncbi:molybdopterin molybdotransferase MoeA [Eubacteriaceae bacterium ES2]|nr:molybdopterin molybdotransferase MoeA [Eubacteriaceae bacterium ES2]